MLLKLTSLLGLAAFIALAWGLSTDRKRFPTRTVVSGILLQFIFGFLILKTGPGQAFFKGFADAVTAVLDYAAEGSKFVFGPLADQAAIQKGLAVPSGFVFVITVAGTIIFVSALSSLLYHYGILQLIVRGVAWVMERLMKTSGSESLAAAANIFMGQTEAPLVIKPYLAKMTRSEIMALMTGGMATIAGGVLAAYVGFGVSAGHLLTASVMSAPAALLIAKIMLPETEPSETAAGAKAEIERQTHNGLDALCRGASDGALLTINVMAMLIAFVAVVALANGVLSWLILKAANVDHATPLQTLFGWVNYPFAWIMGVPVKDCFAVGQILGERIVLNEFIGYLSLAKVKDALDPRSVTLTTYALCGFANFASIAIQIGGIGSMMPERRANLAKIGLRAMIGGLLACYVTATVAGILVD